MNKQSLITSGLLFCQLMAGAQTSSPDSSSKPITQTDIELVYNQYLQDGNNSAVTGGIGTEELQVYGPQLNGKVQKGKGGVSFSVGGDLITSASTDRIDFIISNASSKDIRAYANGTYSRKLVKKDVTVEAGAAFSMESDYTSFGSKLGIEKEDEENLRTWSAQVQVFNDDLRWGRLNTIDTLKLIYPKELRDTNWIEGFRRHSVNVKLGLSQAINKRNIVGIYPEFTIQKGVLETPFHRIFFADSSQGVEQLPEERFKAALALRWNTFAGGRFILKNSLQGYGDTFGILGVSFENETVFKLRPDFSIMANVRGYAQTGSRYFLPYREHVPTTAFYTSDWDLSSFTNYQLGLGINFKPFKYLSNRFQFKSVVLRYYFQKRSNGLVAHIFSLALQGRFRKK